MVIIFLPSTKFMNFYEVMSNFYLDFVKKIHNIPDITDNSNFLFRDGVFSAYT